jgi:nucleotide-binding universal stress UspA family protein
VDVILTTVIEKSPPRSPWLKPPLSSVDVQSRADLSGMTVVPPRREQAVLVETSTQAGERARNEAKDYLERIAHKTLPLGAQVDVLDGDDAAGAILEEARKRRVDVIAMTSHGRSGLARLITGSVATKVLAAGVAPVLLVRPKNLRD